VKIFVKNKNSFPKIPRKRKVYKMDESRILFIENELEQNPELTIQGLTNKINNCFDKKISYTLVLNTLRQQGLRLKAIKKQKSAVSNVYQQKKVALELKTFYDKIQTHALYDIICVDDTSLGFWQTTNNKTFVKYKSIFAINSSGLLKYDIYESSKNKDRLIEFFEILLENKENQIIILKNSQSYKSIKLQNLIQNNKKNNVILYSVPSQQKTQAIKGFFDQLKLKIRGVENLSYDLFCEFIKKIVKKLPVQLCSNLIRGAYQKK
jgi:transposase